ncbi:MAG: redoxin family protein [Myxococcales bacterium]|jgi:DNA-binding beta-propeller fold protein YncE
MNLHSLKPCSVHAPQLSGEYVDWLNVERPLQLGDLRGKVAVLHFWAYSNIHCLHNLRAIARVEEHLAGQPIAFIGVHTPKFGSQKRAPMVRAALSRHGVKHPVVMDSEQRLWDDFGVSAWPTFVVIDAEGYVVGQAAGEAEAQQLENLVLKVLEQQRERGVALNNAPLPVKTDPAPAGALAWPGKVLAHGNRLFIADTAHNQIVELVLRDDYQGHELRRFGSGHPGLIDASGERAELNAPNGMALDPAAEVLWVADTGNHAIRMIDLRTGEVRTVAGTGELARRLPPGPLDALRVPLRSPWDLAWDPSRGRLHVAMAGTHQLWSFAPDKGLLELLAGDGREARVDGSARFGALAQPSGLSLAPDGRLFIADSESSCARELDLETAQLETLAGGDLFVTGDEDGVGEEVRFAHPMGVAFGESELSIADTFNHRIKALDPATGRVRALFGNGHAITREIAREEAIPFLPLEADESTALFFEPQGLAVSDRVLYVADTNNHRVLAIELDSGVVRHVYG